MDVVFRSQLLQLNGSLGIVINIPLGAYWFMYPVESVLNYIQQNHYAHPLPKNEQKQVCLAAFLFFLNEGLIIPTHPHHEGVARRFYICLTDLDITYHKRRIEFCKGKRLNTPAINRNTRLLCIAPMNTKYYLSTKKSMLALNLNLKHKM